MKILLTGTEGYIGSLLPPLLMQRGHEVTGLDTGFYKRLIHKCEKLTVKWFSDYQTSVKLRSPSTEP